MSMSDEEEEEQVVEEYEVEQVLSKRGDSYLVKWKGWEEPTWEEAGSLKNVDPTLFKKHLRRYL